MIHVWTITVCPPDKRKFLSLRDARSFLKNVWRIKKPRDPMPKILDGRYPRTDSQTIELPYWARTAPIILHEIAHILCQDDHGPKFMETVINLYSEFLNIPKNYLEEEARNLGL